MWAVLLSPFTPIARLRVTPYSGSMALLRTWVSAGRDVAGALLFASTLGASCSAEPDLEAAGGSAGLGGGGDAGGEVSEPPPRAGSGGRTTSTAGSAGAVSATAGSGSDPGSAGGEGPGAAEGGSPAILVVGGNAGQPPLAEPGGAAGAGGSDDATAAAGAAGAAPVELGPCSGLTDGPYCGDILDYGDANTRYFCVDGAIYAEAECPSTCWSYRCLDGNGSSGGEPTFGAKNECLNCVNAACQSEVDACDSLDCDMGWQCSVGCDETPQCAKTCEDTFGADPIYESIRTCAKDNCVQVCKF